MAVTVTEIVRELQTLPPGRVTEVYNFVLFLKSRSTDTVDENDAWSDKDCRDAATASQQYAEALLASEEEQDD